LLLAHGIKGGDEVIVPSFTFIATAMAPLYVGARPIFADIEPVSLGLDPLDVEKRITDKTKAILPIHYGGSCCRIKELRDIADDNGILLLEDAAESFGASTKGKRTGTLGESSVFSFCQNKVFTTGEGGCVVTHDDRIRKKLDLYRSYGREAAGDYFNSNLPVDYVELGYNWRMSSIVAALGVSQLKRIKKLIDARRRIALRYDHGFKGVEGVSIYAPPKDDFCVYQMYTIRVAGGAKRRDALSKELEDEGITSKVYFEPAHKYGLFKDLRYRERLPVTERMSAEVLSIPIFPTMTDDQVDRVIQTVVKFQGAKGG
jgi:perosamine synthetase